MDIQNCMTMYRNQGTPFGDIGGAGTPELMAKVRNERRANHPSDETLH